MKTGTMKYIYIILWSFLLSNCSSQKEITINQKLDSSSGKEIVLVKIINDSRCPENVQCIWAGEVSFEVAAYENNKMIEQVQLTLNPNSQEEVTSWFKSHLPETKTSLKSIAVLPYPRDGVSVKLEDYNIRLNY